MEIQTGKTYCTRLTGREVFIFAKNKANDRFLGIDSDGEVQDWHPDGRFPLKEKSPNAWDLVIESDNDRSDWIEL